MMGGKVVIAAGFVIFSRLTPLIQYLFLLHSKPNIDYWTPPKGHVDAGETDLIVTALRELQEETGLILKDLKVYNYTKVLHYKVKRGKKPKEVHYFLAELINPQAIVKLSREHQDFKWLVLPEACEIASFENMKVALKEFDQYIRNNLTNITDLKNYIYPIQNLITV